MSETLEMLGQVTSKDMTNTISSQESESGLTLCVKPVGTMKDQSGQEVALANLSARQAKEKGLMTSGTCGQRGSGSLASASLTSFLGNRLQLRVHGSILYQEIWKKTTTPLGRQLWEHTASVLHIKDKDFISLLTGEIITQQDGTIFPLEPWPTPKEQNARGPSPKRDSLYSVAELADLSMKVSGHTQNGSDVRIVPRGQLNPAHSRWLMGLPTAWDDCAATVMQSAPRLQKLS